MTSPHSLMRSLFNLILLNCICIITTSLQASAVVIASNDVTSDNNTLQHGVSAVGAPYIPSLSVDWRFEPKYPLKILEVYQTAIDTMYILALRDFDEILFAVLAEHVEGYQAMVMFFNPQRPDEADQLQVRHCVDALFRAVLMMTDAVMFCQLRGRMQLGRKTVGVLTITSVPPEPHLENAVAGSTNGTQNASMIEDHVEVDAARRNADHGTLVDSDNFLFLLEYHWFSTSINAKEVSLAILDALASAAPFDKDSKCQELYVVSPGGDCIIFIDSAGAANRPLTYGFVVRALKLLYDKILVPQKRWGSIDIELRYNGVRFGDLRVLKGSPRLLAHNSTAAVASSR